MRGGKVLFTVLLVLLTLSLSGCVSMSLAPVRDEREVTLPMPARAIPEAPDGDSATETPRRLTFYYVSADQQQLTGAPRYIRLENEETMIETAIERLLDASSGTGLLPIAPEGTQVEGIERSGGIVTVDLSVDALTLTAQQLAWMRAAIVNTISGIDDDIKYVNILIGGMVDTGLTLPVGALMRNDGNLTTMWAQYVADEERYVTGQNAGIERYATIEYATWQDELFLPEVRKISIMNGDYINALIDCMREAPSRTDMAHAAMPADAKLNRDPLLVMLSDGRRVVQLSFSESINTQLARDGLSQWQFYGALARTLTHFVPEINGIAVYVGGRLVVELERAGERIAFADGVMEPDMFAGATGAIARLYFATADNRLIAADRVLSLADADSPRALIKQLMLGPYVFDAQARPVMPEGVTEADILGIRIADETALVNLSSNFYRLCQGLNEAQERCLVYAMVNTLTQLENVRAVRFYIADQPVDYLAQSIYLRGTLLANPGLVNSQ